MLKLRTLLGLVFGFSLAATVQAASPINTSPLTSNIVNGDAAIAFYDSFSKLSENSETIVSSDGNITQSIVENSKIGINCYGLLKNVLRCHVGIPFLDPSESSVSPAGATQLTWLSEITDVVLNPRETVFFTGIEDLALIKKNIIQDQILAKFYNIRRVAEHTLRQGIISASCKIKKEQISGNIIEASCSFDKSSF